MEVCLCGLVCATLDQSPQSDSLTAAPDQWLRALVRDVARVGDFGQGRFLGFVRRTCGIFASRLTPPLDHDSLVAHLVLPFLDHDAPALPCIQEAAEMWSYWGLVWGDGVVTLGSAKAIPSPPVGRFRVTSLSEGVCARCRSMGKTHRVLRSADALSADVWGLGPEDPCLDDWLRDGDSIPPGLVRLDRDVLHPRITPHGQHRERQSSLSRSATDIANRRDSDRSAQDRHDAGNQARMQRDGPDVGGDDEDDVYVRIYSSGIRIYSHGQQWKTGKMSKLPTICPRGPTRTHRPSGMKGKVKHGICRRRGVLDGPPKGTHPLFSNGRLRKFGKMRKIPTYCPRGFQGARRPSCMQQWRVHAICGSRGVSVGPHAGTHPYGTRYVFTCMFDAIRAHRALCPHIQGPCMFSSLLQATDASIWRKITTALEQAKNYHNDYLIWGSGAHLAYLAAAAHFQIWVQTQDGAIYTFGEAETRRIYISLVDGHYEAGYRH